MRHSPSEKDYYERLDHDLQTGVYDYVATPEEFARFRAAMVRWLDKATKEWEQLADDLAKGIQR